MNDLTDAKQQAEIITAEHVYQLGKQHGTDEERAAVIGLLNEIALGRDDLDDVVWELKTVIKAGGHRAVKP
jgi:hypothetical protein